jgi:hypothetical protein
MQSSESNKVRDPLQESFEYQLGLLKAEIDIIDKAIARLDEITQTIKNWTILIWIGVITLALSDPDLRQYIVFTAIIPIPFWILNAKWTYLLRGFIFRQDKIAQFLNSDHFVESFKQQKLVGIQVLDPRGAQYRKTEEYRKIVNFWRSFKYPEQSILYLGLAIMSIVVGLYFILSP